MGWGIKGKRFGLSNAAVGSRNRGGGKTNSPIDLFFFGGTILYENGVLTFRLQIVNPKGEMKGSAITGPVGKEAAELWPVSQSRLYCRQVVY